MSKPPIRIALFIDPIGTGRQTPEEEEAEFRSWMSDMLRPFGRVPEWVGSYADDTMVQPEDVHRSRLDIYAFDYGGMMPGASGLMRSHLRSLRNAVLDCSSTLFVLLTRVCAYMDLYDEYIDSDVRASHNFVIDTGSEVDHALECLFSNSGREA